MAVAVIITFVLMMSKLVQLYNEVYESKIKDNLAAFTFLHKEYEKILVFGAERMANNRVLRNSVKRDDLQDLEQKLHDFMALEALNFSFIVRKPKDGGLSLVASGHQPTDSFQPVLEELNTTLFSKVFSEERQDPVDQYYKMYLPLTGSLISLFKVECLNPKGRDLAFVTALPIKSTEEDPLFLVVGRLFFGHQAIVDRMNLLLTDGKNPVPGVAVIMMSHSEVLYSTGDQTILEAAALRHDQMSVEDLKFSFNGREVDGASYLIQGEDAYLVVLSDRTNLKKTIWQAAGITALLIFITMLVFLIILNWFLRGIFASIKNLQNTTERMEKGDLSARAEVLRKDELGAFAKRFNKMAESLQEKVRQISIQSERENQLIKAQTESELRSLRSQMQPHFLFNTLHMISSMVEVDPKGSMEMLNHLSSLYRMIMKSATAKTSPLTLEIEIVENYLNLQKKRFGSRLDYRIDNQIDSFEDIYIPGLILQTLVENAVKYGIEEAIEGGQVIIKISRHSPSLILVQVKNSGMPLKNRYFERMGLANTRERLQLLYGDQHYFQLFINKENLTEARFFITGARI
jgi:sensor histidine kinase YesM